MKEAEEEKRFEEVMRKESTREIVMRKESAKEIVMRKESAKEIEDIFGDGKDGSSRCSKKGGRKDTDESTSFKKGPRTGRIVANGGEHLEGIPMSLRIAQNLTTPRGQNLTTPRGHGRRDGETKQVKSPLARCRCKRDKSTCQYSYPD